MADTERRKQAKTLLVLDGLECSTIIMANEALKKDAQLNQRVAQQFEYLAARCEEALEGDDR